MFRYCCLWVLLILFHRAHAQVPALQWAGTFNAKNEVNYRDNSNGRTVGVDLQGNVYSAGLFSHTVDFDPGPSVYTQTGGGQGELGLYITKLDVNGKLVWAKQLPITVSFAQIELKVDRGGNVYLASYLGYAPADMDPGPGVHMMSPTGFKDAFVLKINPDGNLVWAAQFGGPGDTGSEATALDLDEEGNVIVCGTFNSTIDFDPGPGVFNLTSSAHIQSFIVKLNKSGNLVWALQFGNSPVVYSGSYSSDVKCDRQGNIYTTGAFSGTCDFDPGPGVYSLSGTGFFRDAFMAKLDPNGKLVWVKQIIHASTVNGGYVEPKGIDLDGSGNIVTVGWFNGTHDFDPGPESFKMSSQTEGPTDAYLLKLNGQGDFLWAKSIGGETSDTGNDLSIDSENNIYLIGSFGLSVDFDPGPAEVIIKTPGYGAEALVKLTSEGMYVYAIPFPGINGGGSGLFRRMAMDANRNIYITGYVSGTIDADPGTAAYPITGSSDQSPFVLKLARCKNVSTTTLNINTCDVYTLNNELFDSSGTYVRTLLNATGCDSVITLHLTILKN